MHAVPVITMDGPSGVGKGTLSQLVANQLGWHWLDSGAIYRAVAYAVRQEKIPFDEVTKLISFAQSVPIQFIMDQPGKPIHILLQGIDITTAIRSEQCGQDASAIAAIPEIRGALLIYQRAFRQAPGLVADGRDMGTVVFPDAILKIFLQATLEERAKRRYQQLQEKGNNVTLCAVIREMKMRDMRDSQRSVAPLEPAKDAMAIDTTHLSVEEVFQQIMAMAKDRLRGYCGQTTTDSYV